eukprot:scaffold20821_cov47-Attheya_sp.AAC.4
MSPSVAVQDYLSALRCNEVFMERAYDQIGPRDIWPASIDQLCDEIVLSDAKKSEFATYQRSEGTRKCVDTITWGTA